MSYKKKLPAVVAPLPPRPPVAVVVEYDNHGTMEKCEGILDTKYDECKSGEEAVVNVRVQQGYWSKTYYTKVVRGKIVEIKAPPAAPAAATPPTGATPPPVATAKTTA
jgi:hypothetical protein